MDFLTHLFLPLLVVYVVFPDLFESPLALGLAPLALLADFDKFLGMPGLMHSLVTLVPICLLVIAGERYVRGETWLSPVVVGLVLSHLVLDFVDGGPVPLLYPFIEQGIGLQYPMGTVFGEGWVGVRFEGPLVSLRTVAPDPTNHTYGFIQGAGVASMIAFWTVYVGDRIRSSRMLTTNDNSLRGQ